MALTTKAGLSALITLVDGISTVQGTPNRGVPEYYPALVSAYVAVGLPTVSRRGTSGLVTMVAIYFVGFTYAIQGAEPAAEDDLAETIDAFVREIERDPTVGNVFDSVSLVSPGFASPDFQLNVGQEVRHVQFVLEATMRETIARRS